MKKVFRLEAVLDKEKGLEFLLEEIPVLKESEKAIVLDTEDFKTVYKERGEKRYSICIDEPKHFTVFGLSKIIGIKGFFTNKEKAKEIARYEVKKYLLDKKKFYFDMIDKINTNYFKN